MDYKIGKFPYYVFVTQDIALYQQVSIREMIGYYGRLYGMSNQVCRFLYGHYLIIKVAQWFHRKCLKSHCIVILLTFQGCRKTMDMAGRFFASSFQV